MALGRQDRVSVRHATTLLCDSNYMASVIAHTYGRLARVTYPGVDLSAFRLESGTRSDRALSVGALDPTKGHDLVVRALATLHPGERPGLDIVYERALDGYSTFLVALGRDLGVDVALHRGLTDAVLARMYGSALVTICAATLEPFGLTVLESTAVGTPVIAANEGGFRETVQQGRNGLLVERNPASLAAGIRQIKHGALSDPAQVSLNAVAWSWERTADGVCSALDEAVLTGITN